MFSGGLDGGANVDSWEHFYTYDPVCRWPYVNKGWAEDGEPGMKDVVMDDCSITMAQASGTGYLFGTKYDTKCAIYSFIAFIPFLLSWYYLKLAAEARPKNKKSKYYWFPFYPHRANMNEKMIATNCFFSICVVIVCSDIECLSGRLDWESSRSFFNALAQAVPTHIAVMLVTAWVTVVDGGKHKKTPTWARVLEWTSIIYLYLVSVTLSLAGYHICLTDNDIPLDERACEYNHYPSEDGIIAGLKKMAIMLIFLIYGLLSGFYGLKITRTLRGNKKSGKESSPEEKRIRKWCIIVAVLFLFGFWGQTRAIGPRWNRTIKIPSWCEFTWTSPMSMIFFVQYAMAYALQPMKGKKKLTTHLAHVAMSKFKSTSGLSSRSGTSRKSTSRTGKSSTKGSSGTSTGTSSSGSRGSSGASSGASSAMSDMSDVSSIASDSESTASYASEMDSTVESMVESTVEEPEAGNGGLKGNKVVPMNES